MRDWEQRSRDLAPAFRELLGRIPLPESSPLPPDWLRWEMFERYVVLQRAPPPLEGTVLEVGSGPHAIATLPLGFFVGPRGRVLAIERSRWGRSRSILAASGMADRVGAVAGDALRLPVRGDAADLAVCIHGLRSLGEDSNIVNILREMFRVARRLMIVESLPTARTEAQRAHLAMYDLRNDVFLAATGHRDDLPYRPLDRLAGLVEAAGGDVEATTTLDVDLPHRLAYFPRSLVESLPDGAQRSSLLGRWDEADAMLRRSGEDHPPVGTVVAARRG